MAPVVQHRPAGDDQGVIQNFAVAADGLSEEGDQLRVWKRIAALAASVPVWSKESGTEYGAARQNLIDGMLRVDERDDQSTTHDQKHIAAPPGYIS